MYPTRRFSDKLESSQWKPSLLQPDYAGMVMWPECQRKDWLKTGDPVSWRMRRTLRVSTTMLLQHRIDLGTVQALAADRVQWRHMLLRQRDVCDAGHSND